MIHDEIEEGITNIVSSNTTKKIIYDVLKDAANAVKHTLGPGGKTTFIQDPNGITSLYPSKDGHRLIFNLHYSDFFYEAIYFMLRDVSNAVNIKVGDGTTSCVVILEEFYITIDTLIRMSRNEIKDNGLYNEKILKAFKYLTPIGLTNVLEAIKEVIQKKLYELKYIIRLDELSIDDRKKIIRKIGAISANNDYEIGDIIGKLYDTVIDRLDELFIDIVPNEGEDTTSVSEIGYEAPIGGINHIYSNQSDGETCIFDNPKFLLIEGPLLDNDLKFIEPIIKYVCLEKGQPLVIIADDFSNLISEYFYKARTSGINLPAPEHIKRKTGKDTITIGEIPILPIMHTSSYTLGRERLEDLAVSLGATIQICQSNKIEITLDTPYEIDRVLGGAKKIISGDHLTRIFNGEGDKEKINYRISQLENILRQRVMQDSEQIQGKLYEYKERIGMLKSNMVKVKVGGKTYKEKQFKVLVFEDAVYAVKSAIKNGYTLSGNTSIAHLITYYKENIVKEVENKVKTEGKNIIFGKSNSEDLILIINTLLDIIKTSFMKAYKEALKNALIDEDTYNNIKSKILLNKDLKQSDNNISDVCIYNLMADKFETLKDEDVKLISPGNIDYEIMDAVIGVANNFSTVENIQTNFIPRIKNVTDKTENNDNNIMKEKITKI
jgi:chaperonin GroEL (HSP60 family)